MWRHQKCDTSDLMEHYPGVREKNRGQIVISRFRYLNVNCPALRFQENVSVLPSLPQRVNSEHNEHGQEPYHRTQLPVTAPLHEKQRQCDGEPEQNAKEENFKFSCATSGFGTSYFPLVHQVVPGADEEHHGTDIKPVDDGILNAAALMREEDAFNEQ